MESFEGRVAVVTGAGSGIGRALCVVLAREGASVVAADIEEAAMQETVARITAAGSRGIGVVTDVTDRASVEALADTAWRELGEVNVVCNNAGVFAGGWSWDSSDDDWEWVLGVNLRGIVNGIRAFVPRMIGAEVEGHIINTASIAGVVAAPMSAVYCTSKFAAVGLTESLHHDLQMQAKGRIGVSVLCPGMVHTNIAEGDRNRPSRLADVTGTESARSAMESVRWATDVGIDPEEGARQALEQVKAGRYYVTTHPELFGRLVAVHNADRRAQRAPTFQMYE